MAEQQDRLSATELDDLARGTLPRCVICGAHDVELLIAAEDGRVLDAPFTGKEIKAGELACMFHRAQTDAGAPVKVRALPR